MYPIQTITEIINGQLISNTDVVVNHLVYDSRRLQHPETSLFFALQTTHADGHQFIADAYKKGVRAFVVSERIELQDAAVILVQDSLEAIQSLSAYHRRQFNLPVVGITGSNGKTVVKEWLNALLEEDYQIVRSPKSFNSQIGVPLSVWQISQQHTLGVFEAGISKPGEMQKIEKIIQPTIGVLTNIGDTHSEGFKSNEEKLAEKLKLFIKAGVVIGQQELLATLPGKKFTWSLKEEATLMIQGIKKEKATTILTAVFKQHETALRIPFADDASIQNAITCWCVLLYLNIPLDVIQRRFSVLHPVDMRLQLAHGINY